MKETKRSTSFRKGRCCSNWFTKVASVKILHRKGPRRRPTERPTKMNEVPNEILRSLEISAMMVLETPSVPSVSP